MKETNKNTFSLRSFLLKTLADPVLWYTVLIMTSLMYHFRNRDKEDYEGVFFALGFGAVTFVVGWLLFRVFDFMQKRHILGFLAYTASVGAFALAIRFTLELGQINYPITWMLWFLTPQDSVDYNFWFAVTFFLLFLIFMASVIYYFTRVRYRIFMNFLIFIIPFVIYGKEYEKMPTLMIILLAVGYILLMVYYRQLRDSEDTEFVERRRSWKPIAVYAVIFAAVAALFPKPYIEADRTTLETLINADMLTDKLVEMLNVFRNTTGDQRFRSNVRDISVYEAISPDDLHLKMATYSKYSFDDDTWSVGDLDLYYDERTEELPLGVMSPMGMADAFLEAASLDEDYAEKYGLTKYVKDGLDVPELRTAHIFTVVGSGGLSYNNDMAPVPQNAVSLIRCSKRGEIATLTGGTVTSVGSDFGNTESFTFEYSADTFFLSSKNKEFVDELAKYDYNQLLEDTDDVLYWAKYDDEDKGEAYDYFGIDYRYYDDYLDELLDYGNNKRIKELADELTKDAESEYDKARILESYFYNNDYIYDLGYEKEEGENAEDFIFETKTGVCYEYATSMVLLARAAGIPARYCEGYNMNRREQGYWNQKADHVVTTRDAHGYPQLYIKGYGWTDFEPTVTDNVQRAEKSSATNMLSRAGLMILTGALLVLLGAFLYPRISHRLFVRRARRKAPAEFVRSAMLRICKLYDIEDVNTSAEAAEMVREATGADISETSVLFDRAAYGGEALSESDRDKALSDYVAAYEALRESKKRRGITNRQTMNGG
ncbi:transglutaminase domain-containing protein [Ruminococcus sp.]|uniref:transglutaminase domain-containing protein n=1 Tax=Ruminococcus sp. TaxID=41978 RepID=UPI002CBF3E3D|nr:transglutaminase domain-containing protein [Ruminococcus sp.]HNZ99921.1 transglutaminase domain-containing protein [Ruminococcus sp.]